MKKLILFIAIFTTFGIALPTITTIATESAIAFNRGGSHHGNSFL